MTARSARVTVQAFWTGDEWSLPGILGAGLTLPVIYSLLIPFVVLDVWVQLYQALAFRVLGIAPVRRRHYLVLDRHRLGYLNTLQKANCAYCGYINGLIAFVREVGARTEQFWCPIRHATATRAPHGRYRRFAPYGDAAAFHRTLPVLRRQLGERTTRRRPRHR